MTKAFRLIVYFFIVGGLWPAGYLRAEGNVGGETENWWGNVAEKGLGMVRYNLGVAYENGVVFTKDPAEAAKYYRDAAEHGTPHAQNNLGCLYYRGTGVP